jgi:hypothetical protein
MRDLEFTTKAELFAYLRENHDKLLTQKKEAVKYADTVDFCNVVFDKEEADKAQNTSQELNKNEIQVKVVINTTNLIDSHMDLHIEGLWKKSLKENKRVLLLKEHKSTFEDIISNQVEATTKTMSWSTLGFPYEGTTQALIFDAKIQKDRNPYMFDQYKAGYVENHSVGMRYIQLALAINSEDDADKKYKETWDKYYPLIANKSVAEENGYFWAVTEAKMLEGSAVVFGSNYATPTLSVKTEPEDTPAEPSPTRKSIFEKFEFIN